MPNVGDSLPFDTRVAFELKHAVVAQCLKCVEHFILFVAKLVKNGENCSVIAASFSSSVISVMS